MTVMTRIAWATDLHFNFAAERCWQAFADSICDANADCLLIGGDISEADDCLWHLQRLASRVAVPLHFVLGNHDFYHSGFDAVREAARDLSDSSAAITYLTGSPPIQLTADLLLVGDDAPADARCGSAANSPVHLNDFHVTEDYLHLSGDQLWEAMRYQGTLARDRLAKQLEFCTATRQLIVLTHAPVFRESCWHEGQISDDDWAPFFVCQAIGELLLQWCTCNPEVQVTVLSGHTHGHGRSKMLPNLRTWTASAEYGTPRINALIQTDELLPLLDANMDLDLSA